MNSTFKNELNLKRKVLGWIPSRRTLIVLIVCCVVQLANTQVYSQSSTVSLDLKNVSVEQVLNEIESKTTYRFLFNKELVDVNRKVTVKVNKQNISQVLNEVFKGTDVTFSINGKQIVLIKTENKSTYKALRNVSGIVTDQKGEPIIGASLLIKGTKIGTITDVNGNFSLEVKDQSKLIVSYIGYSSLEIEIGKQKNIVVNLKENLKQLDEVVVIGYGTQKKVNLTGSVSSVTIDQNTASRSLTTVSAGLAGLVPGLSVIQSSGQPGKDGASLRIRGMGTSNNSNPLIVVDGMPDADMNRIDMNDVETVSVLKDAASSAIYGSRAANGVILITTKKGKAGKLSFNYNGSLAVSTATNNYSNLTNYSQNMDLADVASMRAGATRQYSQSTIDMWMAGSKIDPILYPSTNWWDVLYRNGQLSQHNISATAGNEKMTFYGSFGVLDNQGTAYKTWYKRYTGRLNVEANVSSNTAGLSAVR